MTCPGCIEAEANPRTVIKYMGCLSCDARSVAESDEAKKRQADPGALQALMRNVWKNQADYMRARPIVWSWIQRLEALEEPALAACQQPNHAAG
jgi:hypothetical protein